MAVVYLHDRDWWAGLFALALSMGCAAAIGWVAGHDRLRGRSVTLHTGGLSITGPGGPARYGWDELESVTVSGVRNAPRDRTRWTFTVVADDGTVLRLGDDIRDVRELGEAVALEVTSRVVPRHLAAVKAGESVRMGPFTIDLDCVEKDGERIPWPGVSAVDMDNGLVTVHTRGARANLVAVAGQMPDALAFTALCDLVRELTEPS
ncbi:hypothetical protein GCM10022254_39760 [Actinomadura meridiana]|uniref:Secreted protein n=1 Tax=Actinomadura meridiana TaxID=559626 RepID=A0ABP8C6N4_9ACTN